MAATPSIPLMPALATGNVVLHAPRSVVSGLTDVPKRLLEPAAKPACRLHDVLPVKTIVLVSLFLYVSISSGFLRTSDGLGRFVFTHPYLRAVVVFVLAFFLIGFDGPFRLLSRLSLASLVTLIYVLLTGIAETPPKCIQACPECESEENVG